MAQADYFMESDEEALRLDIKTDGAQVQEQARWAGMVPGMRVADLGCGSGKTTLYLNHLVQPGGETLGFDFAAARIRFALEHYREAGLAFQQADFRDPLPQLGHFDFVWMRFVLEYYQGQGPAIVNRAVERLKPGGILCLVDLDYNCLSHYGIPQRMEQTLQRIMARLEQQAHFDPFVGRKLYALLYDRGFDAIDVRMTPHHLIFGTLKDADAFNWEAKVSAAGRFCPDLFEDYPGGFEGFRREFASSFRHPRRFSYTPVFVCRGVWPG